MRDHGCQPTSQAFMAACRTWGIPQALTSNNHPKGHAEPERIMRTFKEECLWRQEWTSPFELGRAPGTGSDASNHHDLHSALGYRTPREVEMEDHHSHSTRFVAA